MSLAVLAALASTGCGATGSVRATTPRRPAGTVVRGTAASCANLTPGQQFAAARVVFDGEMLTGATAPHSDGILSSPARVRVTRYLKGSGPRFATVQTAIRAVNADAVIVSEDGIRPRAGERWRIYASSADRPYPTSICLGSHRLPARLARFSSPGALSFAYPANGHARAFPRPTRA